MIGWRRVRVKAWRVPNEDSPSFDVQCARVQAAYLGPVVRCVLRALVDYEDRRAYQLRGFT